MTTDEFEKQMLEALSQKEIAASQWHRGVMSEWADAAANYGMARGLNELICGLDDEPGRLAIGYGLFSPEPHRYIDLANEIAGHIEAYRSGDFTEEQFAGWIALFEKAAADMRQAVKDTDGETNEREPGQ